MTFNEFLFQIVLQMSIALFGKIELDTDAPLEAMLCDAVEGRMSGSCYFADFSFSIYLVYIQNILSI